MMNTQPNEIMTMINSLDDDMLHLLLRALRLIDRTTGEAKTRVMQFMKDAQSRCMSLSEIDDELSIFEEDLLSWQS